MPSPTGRLADPQWRHERAKLAAQARTTPDYYIARLEEAASDLTDEQRGRLAALLR
jgi:hypothetical protein